MNDPFLALELLAVVGNQQDRLVKLPAKLLGHQLTGLFVNGLNSFVRLVFLLGLNHKHSLCIFLLS